jgi:energy-coupling factor transporter ATP-binding protein EcfA2
MIAELHLKNFRGFKNHSINLRELTVVVGANNAGKSTIVEALRMVSIVATRFRTLRYEQPPAWLDEHGANIGVKPPLGNLEINFDNVFYRYSDPPASITAKFINGSKIQIFLGRDGVCFSSVYDNNGNPINSKERARNSNIPTVSIMPQIGPLRSVEEVLTEDYVRRVASSNLASLHFRNQLKVFSDFLPQLELAVSETWPGVKIEELILPNPLSAQKIYLEIRNEDYVGEVGTMGHGLQMWLQTIWFLCRAQGSGTVILDEPDVYMHADMQRRLIRYIRDQFPQVIITTHSVEIMAEVEPENILVVDRRRPKSQFTSSAPAVQSFIERIGSAQNIHLARLWSARRLILVEGKDLKYFKILQNKLIPDSQNPVDSIPNMSIGGWGGWNYAIGSDMLMKNAVGDQILTYCIFDCDFHSS